MRITELAKFFDLNENSLFIDIGGYKGEFTQNIILNYNSNCIIFEPNWEYFKECLNLFKDNNKVFVIHAGIGATSEIKNLYDHGMGTSFFYEWHKPLTSSESYILSVNILQNFKQIDAMKINCEGSEYEIIESLGQYNLLKDIGNICVEFHPIEGLRDKKYQICQDILQKSHTKTFTSKRWEMWVKKYDNIPIATLDAREMAL